MATLNAVQNVEQAGEPYHQTEYTIYTFGESAGHGKSPQWQKHESLADKGKAVDLARALFDSGHFRRIEIKSRAFDKRANRVTDLTLKTFGQVRTLKLGLSAVVLFAALCGTAAFCLAGLVH